jgi:hypothetical protein
MSPAQFERTAKGGDSGRCLDQSDGDTSLLSE